MRYHHILAALRAQVWGIMPDKLEAIYDVLGAHLRGDIASALPPRADLGDDGGVADDGCPVKLPQQFAYIPVNGVLGKHLSSLDMACGGCSIDLVEAMLASAVADPFVQKIIFDFDTPGGVVMGIPELAAKIRDCPKETVAFTDTYAASCGYWLASACDLVALAPSASVGWVECYMLHIDATDWWRQQGKRPEFIKAGKFTADGAANTALSEAMRAQLQAGVDKFWSQYKADILRQRSGVADENMQGQGFVGEDAVAAGLADIVVPDLQSLVAQLGV